MLVARLRHLTDPGAVADALLERFSLTDAARRRVSTYSGGMRRRLDLAMSLIGDPPVIFLDEPTTGLDPQARLEVWQAVRELAAGGTTVLLTTQYLEEAEQLADRIAILHGGRIIADGTLAELKALLPPATVEYVEKQPTPRRGLPRARRRPHGGTGRRPGGADAMTTRTSSRDTTVLLGRSLRHITRSPDTIITTAVMPIAFLLLFVYVFGGAIHTGRRRTSTTCCPGSCSSRSRPASPTRRTGCSPTCRAGSSSGSSSMPIARSAVLWAHVLTSLVANLVSLAVVVVVAAAHGVPLGRGRAAPGSRSPGSWCCSRSR